MFTSHNTLCDSFSFWKQQKASNRLKHFPRGRKEYLLRISFVQDARTEATQRLCKHNSMEFRYKIPSTLSKLSTSLANLTYLAGNLVITGSDDCTVKIWSPSVENSYVLKGTINTGHIRNIFSAVFVPMTGDNQVILRGHIIN